MFFSGKRVAGMIVLACGAVVLSACGTGATSNPTTAPAGVDHRAGTAPNGDGGRQGQGLIGGGSTAYPSCSIGDAVKPEPGFAATENAGPNQGFGFVTLRNNGDTCSLTGFPSVRLVGSASPVAVRTDLQPTAPQGDATVIDTGAAVGFSVQWSPPAKGQRCDAPSVLQVTVPANNTSITLPVNTPDGQTTLHPCGNELHVSGWQKDPAVP